MLDRIRADINNVNDEKIAASERRGERDKIKKQKLILDGCVKDNTHRREQGRYPMTEERLRAV